MVRKKNNWVLIVPEKLSFLSQLVSISMTGEGLVSSGIALAQAIYVVAMCIRAHVVEGRGVQKRIG